MCGRIIDKMEIANIQLAYKVNGTDKKCMVNLENEPRTVGETGSELTL